MSKSEIKPTEQGGGKKKGKGSVQAATAKGETPKQIMNRHIHDKNDVISEEDFKNLDIGTDLTSDTAHGQLLITDDPDRPKDEDKDPKAVTPWDVIK